MILNRDSDWYYYNYFVICQWLENCCDHYETLGKEMSEINEHKNKIKKKKPKIREVDFDSRKSFKVNIFYHHNGLY